jgi:hypothetical protein
MANTVHTLGTSSTYTVNHHISTSITKCATVTHVTLPFARLTDALVTELAAPYTPTIFLPARALGALGTRTVLSEVLKLASIADIAFDTPAGVYRPFAFSATGAHTLVLVFVADEAVGYMTHTVFIVAPVLLSITSTLVNRVIPAADTPVAKSVHLFVQLIIVEFFYTLGPYYNHLLGHQVFY